MNRENLDIYVTLIGDKRINIRGKSAEKFLAHRCSEVIERKVKIGDKENTVRTIVMSFDDDEKMLELLQDFVNQGIPFCDDYKSTAYMDARALSDQGKLVGEILGC